MQLFGRGYSDTRRPSKEKTSRLKELNPFGAVRTYYIVIDNLFSILTLAMVGVVGTGAASENKTNGNKIISQKSGEVQQ
ncbi:MULTISPECIES: hypothetical protein [Paenibacillus]|uniref:hypothetical protein n=1 Tax=Paenibacillus TaxID=44249 RepID=UPI0005EBF994|nr:hypothetical protein [Paenibacillus polymyxa]KJK28320.1 hypothetical protein TY89_23640 [Paenibacillus polymyxa]URJ34134.1 hypothetical protein MF625_003392 [Paenibacillus polymyxa]WOZ40729.1 hypothetical protein RQP19_12130 [Paenibacillus polymyxa]